MHIDLFMSLFVILALKISLNAYLCDLHCMHHHNRHDWRERPIMVIAFYFYQTKSHNHRPSNSILKGLPGPKV